MARSGLAACVVASAMVAYAHVPIEAADTQGLAGTWALNRNLSQFPRAVGFGMDLVAGSGVDGTGGESRGGSSAAGLLAPRRESEDDARRTKQLVAEVRFIERGGRDEVTRVYDAAQPGAEPSARSATPPASPTEPPPTQGTTRAPIQPPLSAPPSGDRADMPIGPQKADAELKGITALGVVVEELSSQAAACGLVRDTIESAVSTIVTDAGFKVTRNSDEDTYVYVNIITTSASNSLCISRFDASLYSHTTARLSYQDAPLLVQVLLLHQGGLAGGGPREHADSVLRNVRQYVDQFATRIRNAGR